MVHRKSQELRVPSLSEAEIVVLSWHMREGERFSEGEALVDLLCSSHYHSVLAPAQGRLQEILVDAGQAVDPEEVLGVLSLD